jgi:HD-like signal output (HDOD) protein
MPVLSRQRALATTRRRRRASGTFQVRTALKNPRLTVDELGHLVAAEPLMSTKVIRLANSAAINRSGRAIVDIRSAIGRVGMEAVRTVSFAVAMEQLLNSKKMAAFQTLSRRLWEHTMHVAALSRVLARRLTRVNVDEALFAGLVHDIGVFYLLSRAVNFPELVASPRDLHQLLVQWHDHIGHALLAAMGMPEDLALLVQEHELDRPLSSITTLADVVFVANRLANVDHGWRDAAFCELPDGGIAAQFFDPDSLATLLAESAEDVASLKAALGS